MLVTRSCVACGKSCEHLRPRIGKGDVMRARNQYGDQRMWARRACVMLSFFPPSSSQPLPDFQSLLVTGSCHASAPIHLALSHAQKHPNSRPMILSPSRSALKVALTRLSDEWLTSQALCGENIQAVSRVDMLYMAFLCSVGKNY